MAQGQQPQNLAQYIDRFIADAELAHDFVKGDENLDVIGSEGSYPSLAKLVKESREAIQIAAADLQGLKIRRYEFGPGTSIVINHGCHTKAFALKIVNSQGQECLGVPTDPITLDSIELTFTEPESGVIYAEFFTLFDNQ